MKVVKKYVFWSAKSSGSTLISLNMALTHQQWNGEKKVAFLQLSHFPDIHTYLNRSPKQTILDLKYFLDANEQPDTYTKDTYPSPRWNDWEELKTEDVQNIIAFLEKQYDVLYIDVNVSVGEDILSVVLSDATKIVLPCLIDPASLAGVESFFSKYDCFKERCWLIFNQCPVLTAPLIKQKLKRRDINVLGTLPVAKKYLWAQMFEAIPLALRKKSKWKKELFKLLKKLNA